MTRSNDKKATWILAINASQARILRGLGVPREDRLEELLIRSDQQKLKEMLEDRQGRSFPPGRGGRRTAMESGSDPLRHDLDEFLRSTIKLLETHRLAGDLRKLIVFSDPSILGHLRELWSEPLKSIVAVEVAKNIVELKSDEIEQRAKSALSDG